MLTLEHGPAWRGRGSTEISSRDVWSKRAANIETQARPGLYVVYERGSAMYAGCYRRLEGVLVHRGWQGSAGTSLRDMPFSTRHEPDAGYR